MLQDPNRENLKKLLCFLENQIIRDPNNAWFVKDLYKVIAPLSEARISDIHEQCIEEILSSQAEDFYRNFPDWDIKPMLVSDFTKMLHWQRRNNFQEFCFALYQQIEGIVNYLCSQNSYKIIWRNIRDAKFLMDFKADVIRIRYTGGKTIQASIVYDSKNYGKELNELHAMDKFKAIVFLVLYQTKVTINNRSYYNDDFFVGQHIYLLRNLNHRGGELSDYQNEILTTALASPNLSMLNYLGYFSRFISRVIENWQLSPEIVEFAEQCIKTGNPE